MKHFRQISFGLVLAASTVGFSSTAGAANICFAFQDLETEFWVASHKAIVETLTEMGHSVIERNANGQTVNRWTTTGFLAASATTNETAFQTYKVVRSTGMVAFDNQARV